MNHPNSMASPTKQKKKKQGRFNLIDFLIVLIILSLVASIVYLFSPVSLVRRFLAKESQNIYYTVEFQGVDEAFISKITENQTVVHSVSKNAMGTVTAVDYNTKYTELQLAYDEEEAVGVLAEYPNRYNVVVTIYSESEYVEGSGYSVNGQRIAVGEKMALRFPDYAGEGFCIGLSKD